MLKIKCTTISLIAMALVACSNPSATNKEPVANTQSASTASVANTTNVEQTFIVGIDANYQPYTFKDDKGVAQGFDVDIIRAIGEKQGFVVNVVPQSWNELVRDFEHEKHDIALAGFSRTEERAQKYLLSETYAYGQDAIIVKSDNTTIKDFNTLVGHKVATQADSPYIPELEEIMGKGSPNIVGKTSSFLAFKELVMGNVDAVYADEGILRHYVKDFSQVPTKIIPDGKEGYELIIMTPKDKADLMTKINAGLKEIVSDGTYTEIYKKWFNIEPEKLPEFK